MEVPDDTVSLNSHMFRSLMDQSGAEQRLDLINKHNVNPVPSILRRGSIDYTYNERKLNNSLNLQTKASSPEDDIISDFDMGARKKNLSKTFVEECKSYHSETEEQSQDEYLSKESDQKSEMRLS